MRASTIAIVGSCGVITLVAILSVVFVLPALNSQTNISDAVYLEACRSELNAWRHTKAFERRYDFGEVPSSEIDVVYTWVNGSDPEHQKMLESYQRSEGKTALCERDDIPLSECVEAAKRRFADNNELLFSLRSVEEYMPWARHIYIVTNGQVPIWLNTSHPKIRMVDHKDIFKWPEHLPTFNSLAIESHIHRIPGLSEHFIYFNDDMMLTGKVYPSTFYTQANGQRFWFFWPLSQHPDVPIPPISFYDSSKRCPEEKCNCPTEKDIEAIVASSILRQGEHESDSKELFSKIPYFSRKVGDAPPEMKTAAAVRAELASQSGIDHLSPQSWHTDPKLPNIDRNPNEDFKEANYKDEDIEGKRGDINEGESGKKDLKNIEKNDEISKTEGEIYETGRKELGVGRKLLAGDSVRQSLLKTHKLMHETFGFGDRMEPSHIPTYFQKEILQRLRNRFPEEYYAVSSHRFREPTDMHFHFSYAYFYMHERKPFDFTAIFSDMDRDHSGVLETRELQRLATGVGLGMHKKVDIYRSPPLSTDWAAELLKECEFAKPRLQSPWATRRELEECNSAMHKIKEWYGYQLRNKFQLGANWVDSKFLQVGTGFQIKRELEHIFAGDTKFVCLNDDIDYTKPQQAQAYLKITQEFYKTLFPLPSSFERTDMLIT